ncbi:hypothetical protein SCP_0305110 [Sparassis crispa]|uniref:Uncharacterized protein n=1 Tax=Sparassis crispa TaxID=139825 RepID=A0A401GF87_9APHY|nr:hypothetical protein SCP_0305110 [Sparassis crispa]GBE80791.1 hypothetical protein SCP_0305110 [Sparassis crispa]
MSTLLGTFLIFHLWKFDRFRCLKWNNGPYSGAFKRVMTYTYLLTIPLFMAYSIGYTVIKYKMSYTFIAGEGIVPTPYELWPAKYQRSIFPLQMLFSIAWSLEMITHLEELLFWLFLINANSAQQDWFRSLYFKAWIVGSVIAAVYMPLVTIFTRADPLKSEAYTFLAGSLGDLSLTLWFMPVLWTFPKFLAHLKSEGVDANTVVRLTAFNELNNIRVVFRVLFVVPLLVLGVDGILTHHHVNTSEFWTECLSFLAAIGCTISSGITLVIFFPRSVQNELRAKEASRVKSKLRSLRSTPFSDRDSFPPVSPAVPQYTPYAENVAYELDDKPTKAMMLDTPVTRKLTFSPNRRLDSGVTVEGAVAVTTLTERNLARHNQSVNVHPFVHNFTSPIDLMHGDSYQGIARYASQRAYANV